MASYKNYNIRIKGRVQDTGFRDLVENIAKSLKLRGMVYNDKDGTVRIVCGGAVSSVRSLVEELKEKCSNVGASIDDIQKEEIPSRVDLPSYFFKAPTDEFGDFGRKLDVGVRSLHRIEENTDALVSKTDILVEGQNASLSKTDSLLSKTDSLVEGQNTLVSKTDNLVDGQERMIKILERIAEK